MRLAPIIAAICLAAAPVAAVESFQPGSGAFAQRVIAITDPVPAPETPMVAPDGGETTLADHRGKVAVVTIWATWCHVCELEMPRIDALAAEMAGRDIAFAPVSVDDPPAFPRVAEHMAAKGYANLPALWDKDFALASRIGVRGTPTTLIVDRFGQVVAAFEGQAPWGAAEMRAYLDALMAAEDPAASRGLLAR